MADQIPALKPVTIKAYVSEKQKRWKREYRMKNRERLNAEKAAWRKANKAQVNECKREWRAKNREHVRAVDDQWRADHPEVTKRQSKESYRRHKDKRKVWHDNYRKTSEKRRKDLSESNKKYIRTPRAGDRYLKKTYGISLEEHNARLLKQDGKCAICGGLNKNGKRLGVDHCHRTGAVRGLLCSNCNVAIGLMHDDPDMLKKAAAYLQYQ